MVVIRTMRMCRRVVNKHYKFNSQLAILNSLFTIKVIDLLKIIVNCELQIENCECIDEQSY